MKHLLASALICGSFAAPLAAQDAQEDRDVGFIQGLIEDNLSGVGREVVIEGFEGALSSEARIGLMTISDDEGVWFRAEGLVLDWNRSALLRGRLEVQEASADLIAFERAPVSTAEAPAAEATPFEFALPDIPVSIQIERILARRVELGAPLLGEEYAFGIAGSVSLADGDGTAAIVARRQDGAAGEFRIGAEYSNDTRVLALNVSLEEEDGGLVATALGLPDTPSVALTLRGEAPIDDYAADLTIATDGIERIAGMFGFVTVEGEGQDVQLDVAGDVTALIETEYAEFFGPDTRLALQGSRGADGSVSLRELLVQSRALDLTGSAAIGADGWPEALSLQGRIAAQDGGAVTLPVAGGETQVMGVTLDLGFDAASGDTWTGDFEIDGLTRPGLTIPTLTLSGGGVIEQETETAPGRFTGDLTYAATGIELSDDALAEALGADLSGDIVFAREGDGPFRLSELTLDGPGIEMDAEAVVRLAEGVAVESTIDLTASDLARFGRLAGRDLGGAADVSVVSTIRPLDGIFDVTVTGETRALALGIDQLDPLLAGTGEIGLRATRDEDGTRVEALDVATDELTLSASADLTSETTNAVFDLEIADLGVAIEGLEGSARLSGSADQAVGEALVVDADLVLPNGDATLMATVAPEDGPVEIDVMAEVADLAPYSGVAGRDLDGSVDLSLTGMAASDFGTFDLTLIGETQGLAVGIDQLDPLVDGDGSVQARVVRDGPQSFRAEDVALSTDGIDLTATAAFDEGTGSAEFDLSLPDLSPVAEGLSGAATARGTVSRDAGGNVSADIVATGPGGAEIDLDGTLAGVDANYAATAELTARVDNLDVYSALAGQELNGSLVADVTASAGSPLNYRVSPFSLRFDLSGTDLAGMGRSLAGDVTAAGTIVRDETLDTVVDVDVTAPGDARIVVDATVQSPQEDYAVEGRATIDAADLSALSGVVGQPLGGAVSADLAGRVAMPLDAANSPLDLTFEAAATDFTGFGRALDGAFSARGTVARDDTLATVADLTATGPGNTDLSIDATVAPPAQDYAAEGRIALTSGDLSVWSGLAGQRLAGSLDFGAQGSVAAPLAPMETVFDLDFDLTARGLAGMGRNLDGTVAAAGTASRDAKGTLSVDADATGPGDATIALNAAGAVGEAIEGSLTADIGSLAPYSSVAGRQLSGSVDLDLSGSAQADLSGFDVDFDLTGADLSAGGIALSGGIAARGTALRGPNGETDIDLTAQGPGGLELDLEAAGTESLRVDLSAQIDSLSTYAGLIGQDIAGGFSADVSGTTRIDFSIFDLGIDATVRSIDVGIPAVADLLRGVGTIDGRVGRRTDGTLSASNLDVDFPNFSVTGDFDSQGGGGGSFDARLADVGLFVPDLNGAATARGTARMRPGGGVTLDISATGPGGIAADVSGSVGGGGALNLNIDGQAPLQLANPYIDPRRLSGTATFDIGVNGPPALSSVTGTVNIADGRLAAPTLGQALEGIGGTIRLSRSQAQIDLGGSLDTGGRVEVTGPIGLTSPFVADLTVAADGLVVQDPRLYETVVDGRITVSGPLTGGAQIAGTIDIGATEIRVPSSSVSALGDLPDVRHVGATPAVRETLGRADIAVTGGETAEAESGGGGGPAYGLDILVRAPSRIFIRGRGLDAELGGRLRITGTTAQVVPIGEFELIRGRLDILQQRFELDEGSVVLQGDFVPFIRLVARTEAQDGTTVSIIVSGPADDPEVTFSSTPDLPQDEVLSRLIFGRDLSSISPFQAVQLASAVATLSGRGGVGLVDSFRQNLGLDDLDITTDADGNAAVRAGTYVTDNIYTDVTVGSENTEINLNLDLTDSITVTGSAGSDGDTGIGIFYERDY